MRIQDVLNENVQFVEPDTKLEKVAKLMKEHDCGSIPVAEDDKLIGMITDRDIVIRCVAESGDPESMTAMDCMSAGMLYCFDTDEVEDVIRNMGEEAVRRMPVVNKDKQLVGIVSLGDLSAACKDKSKAGETLSDIRDAA